MLLNSKDSSVSIGTNLNVTRARAKEHSLNDPGDISKKKDKSASFGDKDCKTSLESSCKDEYKENRPNCSKNVRNYRLNNIDSLFLYFSTLIM